MSISFENKFEFNPPIHRESRPFKNFLIPKVLEAHREKHGIDYRISESNNLVSGTGFKCAEN